MGFKRLDPEDFVVSSDTVSSTVWSNKSVSLNTYHTSSVQKEGASGPFYLNVYDQEATVDTSEVQFSIVYADVNGGGSVNYDDTVPGLSPSRTLYGQYRTLVLEDENSEFTFGGSITSDEIYVLSIERSRYKEKLLPGSFNLVLSSSNANLTNLHLTDDSGMVNLPTYYGTQRAYQIISGSNGTAWKGNGYSISGSYGIFLPDTSTIILNASALDLQVPPGNSGENDGTGINLGTVNSLNTNAENPTKLYSHMSGSVGDTDGNIFKLNSQETITSDYVFIRSRNSEFNYSENPSFISGSTGEVIYPYFIDNPNTYPTTVGMYNDSNELLAVAKLSKPLQKDFTKEALIRVKLDF
jgi:hypothetical protein